MWIVVDAYLFISNEIRSKLIFRSFLYEFYELFFCPPFFFCLKDYFIMLLVNYEFDRSTVKPYFFLDIFLRGNFLLTFAFLVESNYVDITSSEILNDVSTLIFIVDMICRNESHEPSMFIGPTQELSRHPWIKGYKEALPYRIQNFSILHIFQWLTLNDWRYSRKKVSILSFVETFSPLFEDISSPACSMLRFQKSESHRRLINRWNC